MTNNRKADETLKKIALDTFGTTDLVSKIQLAMELSYKAGIIMAGERLKAITEEIYDRENFDHELRLLIGGMLKGELETITNLQNEKKLVFCIGTFSGWGQCIHFFKGQCVLPYYCNHQS